MQGRFKKDGPGSPRGRQGRGDAAAEQEPRGASDRGASPQHTQNQGQGPAAAGDGKSTGRPGTAPAAAETAVPLKPVGPSETGSRMALRNWRISTRLVSLLALPVVAATTLGGLRINESLNEVQQLEHMQLLSKMTREATALATALQKERDLTAGPLASGLSAADYKVSEPRRNTDTKQKAFLDATEQIGDAEGDEALQSIRANASQIASQVVTLGDIRQGAYARNVSKSQTVEAYSRLIESLLSLSQDMAQATSNPEMIKRTRALAAFSSAKEYASIQQAIIASALPQDPKDKADLQLQDRLYGDAARTSEKAELRAFETLYESMGGNATDLTSPLNSSNPTIEAANKYAERVLSNPKGLTDQDPRGFLDWTDEYSTKITAMNSIEATLLGEMESKARDLRQESQRDAIINGALILFVLGVSLVGAFVVARSMIRSLRRLQDTATKVAQDRLPELVKQLSESDPQDVDTSVESVGVHSRDEIGQVAAAFDDVHREAVRLAAEQALLRGNVNAMFTNLSRRSQGLIQRQLSLISELESREADPDQLSSLFKLDHLATRMRRNGENLLVLAGEEPGRRWTRPVPLVDVLRAAASEVEQYERIELASVPATEVAGRVVNDLVHLLAELLENATSFSSPQTKVRVTGHALPDGRVLVEIHDTGIGLSPEDLAAINERLASPPTVDVSVSRRMGLFVVGRLSLRHGIRIQLRPSDSGGTTALVMLPVDVAHGGKKPAPAMPGAGGQGAVPQGNASGGRLPAGPGGAGGGRPGLPGGAAGRTGGPRGQVGAGSGPRAALPGRDGAGTGAGAGAPRGNGGPQAAPGQDPQRQGAGAGAGAAMGGFGGNAGAGQGGIPTRNDVWQNQNQQGGLQGQQGGAPKGRPAPQGQQQGQPGQQQGGPGARPAPAHGGFQQPAPGRPAQGDRGRQQPLPPAGGPRAELPGADASQQQRPQTTSWGSEQVPATPRQQQPQPAPRPVQPQNMTPLDAPRGHEEPETTGQFPRPDFPQRPAAPYPSHLQPQAQDPASTAQFPRPDFTAPQPPSQGQAPAQRQRGRDAADFGAPRPPAGALPQQPQPEALPPAGSGGDGRTPLYDTLETNWRHGQGGDPDQTMQTPVVPQQPERPTPPRRSAPEAAAPATTSWRTSPNDELVRQAERVRKPAAGGVTTSGLPKRVPRANLVPGTAQEQPTTAGPQVSRAPDDVRGRLTNLRRGIQQGRQAGNSTTGSFNIGPNHQQER
ncbi:nitrate- and nitrite sensing domain-containing protein [Streptomyces purpureus]|uniref:sensor histidine kinase n=1 Tax=Streptomyces purpureus TaxID=1951 RepID=UPI00036B36FA